MTVLKKSVAINIQLVTIFEVVLLSPKYVTQLGLNKIIISNYKIK